MLKHRYYLNVEQDEALHNATKECLLRLGYISRCLSFLKSFLFSCSKNKKATRSFWGSYSLDFPCILIRCSYLIPKWDQCQYFKKINFVKYQCNIIIPYTRLLFAVTYHCISLFCTILQTILVHIWSILMHKIIKPTQII